MGAVLERGVDPMLCMEYMEHGSLYDILHNETVPLDQDLILPILQDIVSGVRFLHAADPQVVHGDLKTKNIVSFLCDFSTKSSVLHLTHKLRFSWSM